MKTTPHAHVSFGFEHLDEAGLCTEADGTVTGLTGNAFITVIPVALGPVTTAGTITFLTAALRGYLSDKAAGDNSKELTKNIAAAVNALKQALIANGHSVEDQAILQAAGDIVKEQKIILSTGYKLKATIAPKLRGFSLTSDAVNEVLGKITKAGKGAEAHLWRVGIATAKGVVPTVLKTYTTQKATIVLKDLPVGSIVGMQHASVIATPHATPSGGGTTTGGTSSSHRTATPVATSKGNHPTFSWLTEDPYTWTDFLYTVVK